MKNSLILENSEIALYSTADDGTNRLFINNTLIPTSSWVGTGVYTYQNITIHKAESLTGNLMLKKLADFEYFFVNVALKKIYAEEVIFDPTESGIPADNVQDAIDGIFFRMFPIGALYMTATDTNPGTFLGGIWERWGSGRVPVGYDANDSDFNAAEKTGGSKTHTLLTTEMPSHTHSVGAHSHGLNSHTHSVGAHSHGLNSHKHSVGAHSHGLNSHKHGAGTYGAVNNGAHQHKGYYMHIAYSSGGVGGYPSTDYNTSQSGSGGYVTQSAGGHTHTISGSSGAASGNTENSTAFDTGAATGSTANSTAFDTGAASGSTANSTAFDTGSAGSDTAFSILQPYITCFIWKRTA